MKHLNILLTTAGAGNANNLSRSIRASKLDCTLVGTNICKFELAKSITDKNYLVPPFHDPEYIKAVRKIVEVENIDFIIPNHEYEIQAIRGSVDEAILSKCFLPDKRTVDLCLDKSKLIAHLDKSGLKVPKSIALHTFEDLDRHFDAVKVASDQPVWCRLIRGSASAGAAPVYTKEEAKFWISYWEDYKGESVGKFMISEYLPGKDYHYFSLWKNGKLLIGKCIERLAYVCSKYTLSGTSSSPSQCVTISNSEIDQICQDYVLSVDPTASGLFGIDLKCDINGTPCLTEINIGRFPRINYIFNFIGLNVVEHYIRVGLGETIDSDAADRKRDFAQRYFLLRDFDTIPILKSEEEINSGFIRI